MRYTKENTYPYKAEISYDLVGFHALAMKLNLPIVMDALISALIELERDLYSSLASDATDDEIISSHHSTRLFHDIQKRCGQTNRLYDYALCTVGYAHAKYTTGWRDAKGRCIPLDPRYMPKCHWHNHLATDSPRCIDFEGYVGT